MNNFNNFAPPFNSNQFAPITNKTFVNSLQDALNRWSDYNSEMVYFDWYKNVIYNVITDGQGRKTYKIFDVMEHKEPEQPVAVLPKDPLEEKVDKLTKMMEDLYEKYNAKQSDIPTTGNERTASTSGSAETIAKQS